MKEKTASSEARELHQTSKGLTVLFEMLIFKVFFEVFVVFFQIGAEPSLVAPRLVLGRLALVLMVVLL